MKLKEFGPPGERVPRIPMDPSMPVSAIVEYRIKVSI